MSQIWPLLWIGGKCNLNYVKKFVIHHWPKSLPKKLQNLQPWVIYCLFNLRVVSNIPMLRFWVWVSHLCNGAIIVQKHLLLLCSNFVVQVLVRWLQLQVIFFIIHEFLSPPSLFMFFFCNILFLLYYWTESPNLVFELCSANDGMCGRLELKFISCKEMKWKGFCKETLNVILFQWFQT
jgi:hypothetical protein